jgi:hypothetical protein
VDQRPFFVFILLCRPSENSLQWSTITDGSLSKDWQSIVSRGDCCIRTWDCRFTVWCCYHEPPTLFRGNIGLGLLDGNCGITCTYCFLFYCMQVCPPSPKDPIPPSDSHAPITPPESHAAITPIVSHANIAQPSYHLHWIGMHATITPLNRRACKHHTNYKSYNPSPSHHSGLEASKHIVDGFLISTPWGPKGNGHTCARQKKIWVCWCYLYMYITVIIVFVAGKRRFERVNVICI